MAGHDPSRSSFPRARSLPARAALALVYPGLVASSLALALLADAHGVPPLASSTGLFLLVLAVVLVLERLAPHEPTWLPTAVEARDDAAYLGLAAVLQGLGRVAGHVASTLALLALARPSLVTTGSPILRALAAFLVADAAKYALHRLAHEWPWLWRFHAEHHAPTKLHALNATRLHPVNLAWNVGLDGAAIALFGVDARMALLLGVLRGTVSILQHANIALGSSPLDLLFSTPAIHQFHHASFSSAREGSEDSAPSRSPVARSSKTPPSTPAPGVCFADPRGRTPRAVTKCEHGENAARRPDCQANANYGSTLAVWDLVLGTWLRPATPPPVLGLADGAPHPEALRHQLVGPFCASRATTCPWVRGALSHPREKVRPSRDQPRLPRQEVPDE